MTALLRLTLSIFLDSELPSCLPLVPQKEVVPVESIWWRNYHSVTQTQRVGIVKRESTQRHGKQCTRHLLVLTLKTHLLWRLDWRMKNLGVLLNFLFDLTSEPLQFMRYHRKSSLLCPTPLKRRTHTWKFGIFWHLRWEKDRKILETPSILRIFSFIN